MTSAFWQNEEGVLAFVAGLSMRPAQLRLSRQAHRQINLPVQLIAQATKQTLPKIAFAKVSFFLKTQKRLVL